MRCFWHRLTRSLGGTFGFAQTFAFGALGGFSRFALLARFAWAAPTWAARTASIVETAAHVAATLTLGL